MSMRLNILLFASFFMILSCSEKVVDTSLPNESDEIKFGTIATKGVDGIEDIDNFGVWISMTNVDGTSDYVSYLSNERVYPTDLSKNLWAYNKTRYWFEDCYFYFIASYPYAPYPEGYPNSTDGLGVGTFQVLEDTQFGVDFAYSLDVDTYDADTKSHTGVDILTASQYVDTSGEPEEWKKPVKLNFKHLLTKINIKIRQDLRPELGDPDNHYYITKVSLQGVSSTGKYLLIPEYTDVNAESTDVASAWLLDNNTGQSYEKTFEISEETKTLKQLGEVSVWGSEDEGGLLLIPQKIEHNSVRLRIDYLYKLDTEDDEAEPKERYLEAYIPASELWQSNSVITYTLALSNASKITFLAPAIASWGTPQTGGTVIIK